MTELDFLKEHWEKQDNFPIKNREELHKMIKKSSSNILKWLIAANIFELSFFAIISVLFSDSNPGVVIDAQMLKIINVLDYVIYSLPIVFSLIYIYLISKIHATDSVSLLLKNIFRARKLLNMYIYLNVFCFLVIIYIGIYLGLNSAEVQILTEGNDLVRNFVVITSSVIVAAMFMFVVWLFYKLLYGRLLKRLNKNYEELKDL